MHNKETCKIIGCASCDTTASKLLQNFTKKKDMDKKHIEEKFEKFWQKFIDDNGFPSYPNYEKIADFWLQEMENMLETLIENTDCPHEKEKLKEYLVINF